MPFVDDSDGVAYPFDITQDMTGEENSDLSFQIGDQIKQFMATSWIK